MKDWDKRPFEVAHLLNPAFCSILIREFASHFHRKARSPVDYPLAFLLLPVVLHAQTRQILPASTATKLHIWLEENQSARFRFPERTRGLAPYTREAVLFGCNHGLLGISAGGQIWAPKRRLTRPQWPSNTDASICMKAAGQVGRWFAAVGDSSTTLSMWGIFP